MTKCAGLKASGMAYLRSLGLSRGSSNRVANHWPSRPLSPISSAVFSAGLRRARPKNRPIWPPRGSGLSGGKPFYYNLVPPHPAPGTIVLCMPKLTKRDIVVAISNQTGMVQHDVFEVVQRTLDHITNSLASNVAVELRNFGVFQPRLTKPRVGRNPNEPGSSFVIPPRATVKFKAGKIMRQRVEKLSRELKEASERKAAEQATASVPS